MSEKPFMQRAEAVLADTFRGLHNVPGKIKPCGNGIEVNIYHSLATFDFDNLTRLVLSAHQNCVRVEIGPAMRRIKIMIHPRQREGQMYQRHPTIEQAIERFNGETNPAQREEGER